MFIANEKRYDKMPYRHVGKWGLKLPPYISWYVAEFQPYRQSGKYGKYVPYRF